MISWVGWLTRLVHYHILKYKSLIQWQNVLRLFFSKFQGVLHSVKYKLCVVILTSLILFFFLSLSLSLSFSQQFILCYSWKLVVSIQNYEVFKSSVLPYLSPVSPNWTYWQLKHQFHFLYKMIQLFGQSLMYLDILTLKHFESECVQVIREKLEGYFHISPALEILPLLDIVHPRSSLFMCSRLWDSFQCQGSILSNF